MKPKRRLTQIIALLLSGVTLVSILLIGALWIRFEAQRSKDESLRLRREFIDNRKTYISLETGRICGYMEAQRQSSEIQFLKAIRERVHEAYNLVESMNSSALIAPENQAVIQRLILAALKGLSSTGNRSQYYVFTLSGQQLLSSVDYGSNGSTLQWMDSNDFSNPAAFLDVVNNLSLNKEGFFRYNNIQGLKGAEGGDHGENQVVYLKLFEPFNWIIGTGEYLEAWGSGIRTELVDWAANMTMPEDTYLMILNYDGDILAHPEFDRIGQNVYAEGGDQNFIRFISEIIRGAKDRSKDFIPYTAATPQNGKTNEYIAYYRAIPAWHWVVVTWFYFNDLDDVLAQRQAALAESVQRQISNIASISIVLLLAGLLTSRLLAVRSARSFSAFFAFFEQAADTSREINIADQPFEEFARLAVAANHMIRQRQEATTLLRESELKFKTIFDLSPQVITISTLEGVLVNANEEYLKFSRLDFTKALGRPLEDSFFLSIDARLDLWRLLQEEGSVAGRELTGHDAEGRPLTFLVFGKTITLAASTFVLLVLTDVTALKSAEKEKLILQEKLSRSTQMEAMGLMAAEVAHDLNNILSGIIGYPQLLLMDPNLTDKQKDALNEMLDTGQRAAAVVKDLVTIARGVASAKSSLAVNEIITGYANSPECRKLQDLFPAIKLELELDPESGHINGSIIHLSKVVMNLVSNAFEAFPRERTDGVVKIRTGLVDLDGKLPGYQGSNPVDPGHYAKIAVADNGPGISAQDVDKIFEPFYSNKPKERSGTGLGLAIVWNTMIDHNGYLALETGPAGTIFSLYFKNIAEQAAAAAKKKDLGGFQGRGERILVVDDVDIQRKLATKMLTKLGYTPVAVPSGEAAVEYLKQQDVDLVILDMIMRPGINGRETYGLIMEFKPHQKAIIASGMAESEEVAKAQAMGAGQFVNKPYTIEDIAAAVKKALAD
ncbi:MAG: cache domain-containing protein [Candidatus Adiutrix sp.]|nr:cache domain-containing protein [Candidatus Adiutrix sp.]